MLSWRHLVSQSVDGVRGGGVTALGVSALQERGEGDHDGVEGGEEGELFFQDGFIEPITAVCGGR